MENHEFSAASADNLDVNNAPQPAYANQPFSATHIAAREGIGIVSRQGESSAMTTRLGKDIGIPYALSLATQTLAPNR